MKTSRPVVLLLLAFAIAGCTDQRAVDEKARREGEAKAQAEAKARAEATKKEMETISQVFRPRYNKRLEPAPKAAPAVTDTAQKKEP